MCMCERDRDTETETERDREAEKFQFSGGWQGPCKEWARAEGVANKDT